MSDPAIDAVLRAVQVTRERRGETFHVEGPEIYELLCDVAEDAAREMAKPIRERHRLDHDAWELIPDKCAECHRPWPCETAKLIYTTEELAG